MLTYNLKIALKFLRKNKAFAAINLVGLSIALAVSFIIILYVVNELSYNKNHLNRKDIYRVTTFNNTLKVTGSLTPYVLASTLKDEFPQVEAATNVRPLRDFAIKHNEELISIRNPIGTSSDVFDIFTLPLVSSIGNQGLLDNNFSICLSESLAMKLFENGDAVGKELTAIINNEEQILKVTAVYKDIPLNTNFKADCMVNGFWTISPINQIFNVTDADRGWGYSFWTSWVLLDKNADLEQFENSLNSVSKQHHNEEVDVTYSLQNLLDVHLKSDHINDILPSGNARDIRLMSLIALLIVLVAAINYIILSTAVSIGRTKEIAIRKTNGARDGHVLRQLLTESLLLALLVLPLALFLMMQGLPYASKLLQMQIPIIAANIPVYLLVYLLLTLLIGGLSGLYTSLWLSRQRVMRIFNSQINYGKGKNHFQSILIILQLVIFSIFVSSVLIIRSQHRYALNMDPGFHKENVLFLNIGEDFKSYNALVQSLKVNPNIKMVGGSYETMPAKTTAAIPVPHSINPEEMVMVSLFMVDENFLQTLGVGLTEGRYLTQEMASDGMYRCILNQSAVKGMGISDPIGNYILDTYEIIGVANDFYYKSIHNDIDPLMIIFGDDFIEQIAIHYAPGSLNELIPAIRSLWEQFSPEKPLNYFLVEDLVSDLYAKEQNLTAIVTLSAFFILVIAMFGLFGLTLFIAQRRTKEIGIKKAMGCSVWQIVLSFIRINLFYVIIAVAISTPITIVVMREWLNNYAERIEIGWWFFALTFAIAAVVVVLTVLAHSYRAARVNPVEALRYE